MFKLYYGGLVLKKNNACLFLIIIFIAFCNTFFPSNLYCSNSSNLEINSSGIFESFEGSVFPPSGWTKVNVANGSTGWEKHTSGESPVPGFNYGSITVPPGGGNAVAFCNYLTGGTNNNDEWLITPQIINVQSNDSLIFWLRKYGGFTDHMDIKISTTSPAPAAMTVTVALLAFSSSDSGWINYKYKIGTLVSPGSNIYIGFRQWVSSTTNAGASFSLDLVHVTEPVGIKQVDRNLPSSYILYQNYPNPFNPESVITYEVPIYGFVKVIVYDLLGKEIKVLVNEFEKAGRYDVPFNASELPSGIYFYKLSSGSYTESKKMILLR